ncbi:MAG TPA: hypothetical protein VGP62_10650 [Bryobacteraceae bacterium]|nr:hypothetical protein [Bryobacteraceae bacterium]
MSELADVDVDVLEDFRRTRKIELVTWKVELQALRTFFGYFVSRKWIAMNPAKELKAPRLSWSPIFWETARTSSGSIRVSGQRVVKTTSTTS